MNRGLLWGLGGTGALSAWILLNPAPSGSAGAAVVAAAPTHVPVENQPGLQPRTTAPFPGEGASAARLLVLPARWPEPSAEPAARNPFIAKLPPTPKPVATAVVAPPPVPAPPLAVSDYRFWGRVALQGGQRLTYVSRGDAGLPVAVEVGTRLEDGWSVDAINDNAIVLMHTATQQRSTVSIPPHVAPGQR